MIALTHRDDLRSYVDHLVRLNELNRAGQEDSEEADRLRDEMDDPWYRMTDQEQLFVGGLGADLYTLADDDVIKHASDNREFSKALQHDVGQARDSNDYLRVLELLRERPSEISAYRAAGIRAMAYEALGWDDLASLFFERACQLEQAEGTVLATFVPRLLRMGEFQHAIDLSKQKQTAPDHVKLSVSVLFSQAATEHPEAETAFLDASIVLLEGTNKSAAFRFGNWKASDLRELAAVQLAIALAKLRGIQAAIAELSRLPFDGTSADLAYALRGIWQLELGNKAAAIQDLEAAVSRHTAVDVPYVYLAHHHLGLGAFEKCIELCSAALSMGSDHSAELHEWMAISLSELGGPDEMTLAHFSAAMRDAPSNERIRHNFEVFRARSFLPESLSNDVTFEPSAANLSGAEGLMKATKRLLERRMALIPTGAR